MTKKIKKNPKIRSKFSSWLIGVLIHTLAFCVLCVIIYVSLSSFFDTKREFMLKNSNQELQKEYDVLTKRFSKISSVIDNIEERDVNVFNILFESEPYDFEQDEKEEKLKNYERLFTKSNLELGDEFMGRLSNFEQRLDSLKTQNTALSKKTQSMGNKTNYIPAIQPIINQNLTLLSTSYGMRMHPFYRTLTMHHGVDFSISENSRIFATADGRVSKIITNGSTSGTSLTIDHGNGYKTVYNHLNKVNVRLRQSVRRGDIIALSGNSGLSFAPHLHYQVIKDNKQVDPIHYFFMELNHEQYQKIMVIAQSAMQSFD